MKLIEKEIDINSKMELEKKQNFFLETTIGQAINSAIDIGMRAVFPNFVDEQIIGLKNNLFKYGLKDGIKKTISDTIELGKSTIGMISGNFNNISEMENVVKVGGLIDGISSLLDIIVEKINKKGIINYNVANNLKKGKNILLNSIENSIEEKFKKEKVEINNIKEYMNDWKNNFKNKNFENMEKDYIKIEKVLNKIAPFENIIKEAKKIENIHNLIKNNGNNFNLNQVQLQLAEKLI